MIILFNVWNFKPGLYKIIVSIILHLGMAMADITLIVEYLPFLIGHHFWHSEEHMRTWGWSAYLWFHSNFRLRDITTKDLQSS